jgi:AraC-like DNA-binding protein
MSGRPQRTAFPTAPRLGFRARTAERTSVAGDNRLLMLSIVRITPDPLLFGVVRGYQARSGQAPRGGQLLPLMATTETRLDFYFTRATTLESRLTGHISAPATTALIGPRTRRQHDLHVDGVVDVLSVQFEATGLHALLGVSMSALADRSFRAGDVSEWPGIEQLHERMSLSDTMSRRVLQLEAFLIALRQRRAAPRDVGLEWCVAILHAHAGQIRVEQLAEKTGLSQRHFSRLFKQQIGMSPKTYARVVRMQSIIAAKSMRPMLSWAALAQDFGFFDQAHLDKEFRDLADATPTSWQLGL